MTLRLLGESAYLHHFEGGEDDALLLTGSAAVYIGQMRYGATYSLQDNFAAQGPNTLEHLADFEAIYRSEDGMSFPRASWEIGAAYTFAHRNEGEDNHMISLRAVLEFTGSAEFGE